MVHDTPQKKWWDRDQHLTPNHRKRQSILMRPCMLPAVCMRDRQKQRPLLLSQRSCSHNTDTMAPTHHTLLACTHRHKLQQLGILLLQWCCHVLLGSSCFWPHTVLYPAPSPRPLCVGCYGCHCYCHHNIGLLISKIPVWQACPGPSAGFCQLRAAQRRAWWLEGLAASRPKYLIIFVEVHGPSPTHIHRPLPEQYPHAAHAQTPSLITVIEETR